MPTVFIRWMLFISSYFPLTVIFWIFLIAQQPLWAWIVLGVGILGVLYTLLYVGKVLPDRAPITTKIATQKSRDSEVMSYIATYIIPFIAFPLNSWQQVLAILVFLFVLGFVYTNSQMLCINPTLTFFKYQVYEITTEHSAETFALITRRQRRLKCGDTIRVVDVGKGIWLERSI